MEQVLQALSGLVLKAIPTIFLLVLLHLYLKVMLFGPLERTLAERDKLTAGARKMAEESLAAADRKTAAYEAKLSDARTKLYQQQEEQRRQWLDQQTAEIEEARARTHSSVTEARTQIGGETDTARQNLERSSAALADEIADVVLTRRPDGAGA